MQLNCKKQLSSHWEYIGPFMILCLSVNKECNFGHLFGLYVKKLVKTY